MFPCRITPVNCIHSIDLIWLFGYQFLQICRTSVSLWDLFLYFWKIPILKNVCYCLVLHLLTIGFESFALDHSPCARMIWIITRCLILRRCQSPYHRRQNKFVLTLCEQTGWLFINRSPCSNCHQVIRFPLLRRPILVSIPLWVAWWVRV